MVHTRVLIVGAGPAGLTAAIYAARAQLEPVVAAGGVRGQLVPGGQLMITTEVENYPGFPDGIAGPELMDNFMAQAKNMGANIIEKWATDFDFSERPFKCKLGDEDYTADAVILATGAQAKWLGLPKEEAFQNRGISACATCDGPLPVFRNKHLYVVGGGDTAMEEATFLTRFASKVTILVRRDVLRASKAMATRAMENERIEIKWNTQIKEYIGDDELTGLVLTNTKDNSEETVEVGGVFMAIGHEPLTKDAVAANIDVDDVGYIKVHDHVFTNIEGVFAAGDVHDTHFRQAVSAAGFGCMASIAMERWLEGQESK